MSRYKSTGINPENGEIVDIFYGWDQVPGFKGGYFFQVYSRKEIPNDPTGEGLILNEGFLVGMSKKDLKSLSSKWKSKIQNI